MGVFREWSSGGNQGIFLRDLDVKCLPTHNWKILMGLLFK
jgi:hypothetical protein